jgi:hypothetical protein
MNTFSIETKKLRTFSKFQKRNVTFMLRNFWKLYSNICENKILLKLNIEHFQHNPVYFINTFSEAISICEMLIVDTYLNSMILALSTYMSNFNKFYFLLRLLISPKFIWNSNRANIENQQKSETNVKITL